MTDTTGPGTRRHISQNLSSDLFCCHTETLLQIQCLSRYIDQAKRRSRFNFSTISRPILAPHSDLYTISTGESGRSL